ncbi:hypothetical protein PRIEUP_LOCUS874, partial [Pristimantis euphronides]
RYIDDIFILWKNSEAVFSQFVQHLNDNSLGLVFTFEIHPRELSFLDVKILKGEDGALDTRVYQKPTATNSLLSWDSCHPYPLKKGIPFGQYLRLRRNCSDPQIFQLQAKDLRQRFLARGYPDFILRQAYKKALSKNRTELLRSIEQDREECDVSRLIFTYNSSSAQIRSIIASKWHILQLDPDLQACVAEHPTITYRRGRSLRDRLVNSHFLERRGGSLLEREIPGCFPCGNCSFCNVVIRTKKFQDRVSGHEYVIKHFINCKSKGVIYRITCICNREYIGKTKREFRRRIGEHLGDVRNSRNTPVARHVREQHGGNQNVLKFLALELVEPPSRGGDWNNKLLRRELFWIYTLHTLSPAGLNDQSNFTCFI